MGQKKRVVVLQSEKLLNAGIKSLLSTREDVEVIGVAYSDESYASILERTRPDIVIMDEKIMCSDANRYLEILRDYPDVRTIVLRLGDNQMHIYDKRLIQIAEINDFLELL